MASFDLQKRIQRSRRYIDEHFGSQRQFALRMDLAPSSVSRALDPEKSSGGRIAQVEGALYAHEKEGAEGGVLDQLEHHADRIKTLVREARDLREREG